MGGPSAEEIAQRVFNLGLANDLQLQQAWAELGTRNVSRDDFLQVMVRREFLTNYQVERLIKGDKHGYFCGDYKLLYFMGAGSFARVYRAVHKQTGQVVAVKVLRKRYSESPSQYGQFIREGELGCTLRHPNIVPIYEVYSHGTTHFLVMEFVEGRNLRDFVKVRGKIDPVESTRLMLDIASGLRYAFEHGLTHRDLKMSNVLVSAKGRAKLADFGLAAVDDAIVLDDAIVEMPNARTIDYAALERATGVRKDDTRSDIYFMGCIYYNMLTGRPPLSETRDRVKRLSKQRFLDVRPIQKTHASVPNAVAIVVNKAMMLDVNRRYQTPGEMLSDLRIAARRLAEDEAARGESGEASRLSAAMTQAETHRSVMIVESNARMQDVLREGLKKAGYRVLLTSDPKRALERFRQDPTTADCVVLIAQEIGADAVRVFNQFGDDPKVEFVPAMLLLDEPQQKWRKAAKTADRRVVLSMPITLKKLREALGRLIPAKSDTEADPAAAGS